MAAGENKGMVTGLVLFIAALAFLAYLGGIFAAIFQVYPATQIQAVVQELQAELNRDVNEGELHFCTNSVLPTKASHCTNLNGCNPALRW